MSMWFEKPVKPTLSTKVTETDNSRIFWFKDSEDFQVNKLIRSMRWPENLCCRVWLLANIANSKNNARNTRILEFTMLIISILLRRFYSTRGSTFRILVHLQAALLMIANIYYANFRSRSSTCGFESWNRVTACCNNPIVPVPLTARALRQQLIGKTQLEAKMTRKICTSLSCCALSHSGD